ncbi:MAG TPA: YueI family protein [Desulfosporosinus sp.]|nr:YueI family protein [Desulfosporosinus sp.]
MTIENDIERDQIGTFSNKSRLEQALGVDNAPELKKGEKMLYLGEFRERVIRMLSKKQVARSAVFPEIIEAIKDKRAHKMLINGDLSIKFTGKYIKLANEIDKPYTTIHNSELKGDTGLVIVSDQAIDVEKIDV